MMEVIKKHGLLWLLSLLTIGSFIYVAMVSEGIQGGMDSYEHYLISRYAFQHQNLLLDQWGKPFFTLLSSPFSMLGKLNGIIAYNILMAVGSGILGYFIAKKLKFRYPIIAFIAICFAPGTYIHVISGLTEITAGFLVLLFILLYLNESLTWASIVISFLPFVRSEGFIILAVVLVYYVIKKHYRYLGLLTTGSLLYSFYAFIKLGNVLWLFGDNPYLKQEQGVYGSGEFWHYVNIREQIAGTPLSVLWLVGVAVCIYYLIKNKKDEEHSYLHFFVIIGSFVSFIFVHSYIWWQGSLGSAGFHRVFAAVLPLMGISAAYGFSWIIGWLKSKKLQLLITVFAGGLIIYTNFKVNKFPYTMHPGDLNFMKVAEWMKENGLEPKENQVIYHLMPIMNVWLDADPYDNKEVRYLWNFNTQDAPKGAIVVWDGALARNEANIPLGKLKDDPDYELLKVFEGGDEFREENAYLWVYIFRKR